MASLKVLRLVHQCHVRSGIHGWKVVASLKGCDNQLVGGGRLGIHGWKVVASLKVLQAGQLPERRQGYPRLEGRGLIEGTLSPVSCTSILPYPRLEGRGLIEGPTTGTGCQRAARYPRLEGRGLIEGPLRRPDHLPPRSGIHGWKVVASLKVDIQHRLGWSSGGIHGWKIVASLKGVHHDVRRVGVTAYPRLEGCGLIEAAEWSPATPRPTSSPLPKGGGPIEAISCSVAARKSTTSLHYEWMRLA